jgi:hypothetical protein
MTSRRQIEPNHHNAERGVIFPRFRRSFLERPAVISLILDYASKLRG